MRYSEIPSSVPFFSQLAYRSEFRMQGAPFEENLVPPGSESSKSKAERKKLQAILDELNPAGGKPHKGNPSGKHDKKLKQQGKVQ